MILVDTHVIAWLASGSQHIPVEALEQLFDRGFAVSAVTAWEYEDLHRRGRMPATASLTHILTEFAAEVVDFPAEAWTVASALPPVHRDPVDRMLVGHAIHTGAVLATADIKMRRYPVRTLW